MATSATRAAPPVLDDPAVPGDVLLGDGAHGLLAAAVGAAGGELRTATPRQTSYQPGGAITVRFDATVRWPDGRVVPEMLVAAAGANLPEAALVLEDGDHRVAVWRVPHDPHLPGLAPAMDPALVRDLLADLGAPVPSTTPRLRSYRPGRRAVVEVSAPGTRLFIKLVRPTAIEDLHRRHTRLAGHVPVPRSLGWSNDLGLVALQAIPGRTLRAALDQRRPGPSGAAIVELLDRLPDPGDLAGRPPAWHAGRFATLIGAVAPELSDRVVALATQLAAAEREAGPPRDAVHGDLHEAQLLVDGHAVTGLLDVDGFGRGRRVDDLATMIGHLSTLALGSRRRVSIERYAAGMLAQFDRVCDPALLRRAVCAVVLGLATGPFRVLDAHWRTETTRRVVLAERWWRSADRVGSRPAAP